jgi:hypothetical protein
VFKRKKYALTGLVAAFVVIPALCLMLGTPVGYQLAAWAGAGSALGLLANRASRLIAVRAGALALCAALAAGAADFKNYRDFHFGMSLEDAAKPAGTKAADVRVTHRRPALIQEMEWRPGFAYTYGANRVDPVREGVLRFYNGELFQVVATYDAQKVEGLTEDDVVATISKTYGTATKPADRVAYRSNYGDSTPQLARWETADHWVSLVQTGDRATFALILTDRRLEALVKTAVAESARLDVLEAPQRAIEERRKQAAADRLEQGKARATNLPNFRP